MKYGIKFNLQNWTVVDISACREVKVAEGALPFNALDGADLIQKLAEATRSHKGHDEVRNILGAYNLYNPR